MESSKRNALREDWFSASSFLDDKSIPNGVERQYPISISGWFGKVDKKAKEQQKSAKNLDKSR